MNSDNKIIGGIRFTASLNLPIAEKIAKEVICLPIHPELELKNV